MPSDPPRYLDGYKAGSASRFGASMNSPSLAIAAIPAKARIQCHLTQNLDSRFLGNDALEMVRQAGVLIKTPSRDSAKTSDVSESILTTVFTNTLKENSLMSMRRLKLILLLTSLSIPVHAQQYNLLIKGGHVIDPKNQINAVMDVAIAGGKIAQVAANIPASQARTVADATGMYVAPGLIDIHAHVYYGTDPDANLGNGMASLPPDGFTFRSGVTTAVDAGGSGWRTFKHFKEQVIDQSRTRVLALINIVGHGMRGGPIEQDLTDMDSYLTAMQIVENKDLIVGIKTAHYNGPEWAPVDRAVEAGKLANVPVMVDFGYFVPERPFQDLVLKHLRPGDIYTHMYLGRVPMIDQNGKVEPYLFEARKRGVIFDVGHGAGSFLFRQAVPAVKQGFVPDSISTDLHTGSMNAGMKDQVNIMSKFLNLGMTVEDVILRSTWNPAKEIKRQDLGHLTVGAVADIAVISLRKGNFGFTDVEGGKMLGTQKLECELTVREGRVVWDLNGISKTPWEKMPVSANPVPPLQRPAR